MGVRYYNKTNQPGSELFLAGAPNHLIYNAVLLNHIELDDTNVFWSPLPAGQQFTYDGGGVPDGLEAIPVPIYTAEEQARIDLRAAGVTTSTVTAALYADSRGIPGPLAAINASVDLIVISSGLTLTQVSALV